MKIYNYYVDAGHGWVAVKRDYLAELGILNQISIYSYQKGKTIYLEEDGDLNLFVNALTQRELLRDRDWKFNVKCCKQDRSPIRSYERVFNK